MAIYVKTSDPKQLLEDIKKNISDGKIKTWSCDADGDFTYEAEQWHCRAWMRPFTSQSGEIIFGILCRKDRNISVTDYAVFHGRFVEMLLVHFDRQCEDIISTSKVTKYDKVKASNPQ